MNYMKKFKRTKYWFRRLIFSKLLTCLSSIIILFLLSAVQLSAESYVQSKKLTISKTSQSLMKIFNEIEENSEFHFFYDNDEIDVTRKVSISVYNSTI